ncbi:MAG: TraB/GumN family protein [Candidatus Altiarchaeota archaeon]
MPEVVELCLNGKKVYIVGTAHVSDDSVRLVEETVRGVKPDAVAVELCEQRFKALKNEREWDETEITEVIKSGRTYLFLVQILMANFQRQIGDKIGVKPGSEMLKAIEIAEENKSEIVLIDRDITITLKRAIGLTTLREKLKLLYGFFNDVLSEGEIDEELVEKLKEKDMLSELMEELAVETPSIKRVLVDERDEYMALSIASIEAEKIVVVVGAGHVDGLRRRLEELEGYVIVRYKQGMGELMKVEKKRSVVGYAGYAIPLLFLVIIGWGFMNHGSAMTLTMLKEWFLINGTLSALGAALALAHPLTVLTAFIAAPFTSLNPTIAAGWVASIVEFKMRKPRVKDFKNLLKLNSMGDYWRNRVTRILLVIVFANIGSSIGTFIALPYLASLI